MSDFLTGSNLLTAVTGSSGILLFSNLTSAIYTVAVAAPDHGSFSTTLPLAPNQTNDVVAFLPLQLVDYTWVVTPTSVPDRYTFTLETTFQTLVPWPVVTVSPGAIDLCAIPAQANQINLTITNSGLIAAQGLNLYFGTHPGWSLKRPGCARDHHAAWFRYQCSAQHHRPIELSGHHSDPDLLNHRPHLRL